MENELNVIKGLLTEAFGELSAKVAQAQQAAQAPETPGSVKVLLAEVGDLARKLADIIPNPPPAENAAPVAEPAPPAAEAPPAPPATE